ncbi:acyl-CoA dehydrogenase family protein [Kitasatospora sp. NPDC051914]|uniref:acyl-CoA dehydrogenase family protein n=1 Tax=Kitasatospora sp. NPDC051914 TaxID=3154945 RepID=UPI003425B29B
MHFLETERAALQRFMPGLDEDLARIPLAELESPGSPGLSMLKAAGGPSMLIPTAQGGNGASALEATRVQRAIGARSPSLGVASTMHHFSVASLAEASLGDGFEWMLLEGIAAGQLLVASGFAEGRSAAAILSPTLRAVPRGDNLIVTGSKKPCSLSRSMDLLTASVAVTDDDGRERMAVAVIPADSPGLEIRPFWNNFALAGAESDEVVLKDVEVPPRLVVMTDSTENQQPDKLQTSGFIWFELLAAASYLGAASALVEGVLSAGRAAAVERAALVTEAEAAMTMLEGVARAKDAGEQGEEMLAKVLCVRYAVQDAIGRINRRAVELLGGTSFIGSGDAAYMSAACAGLMFHPPSRTHMSDQLCDYFAGRPLRIG